VLRDGRCVYRGKAKYSGDQVALKKINMDEFRAGKGSDGVSGFRGRAAVTLFCHIRGPRFSCVPLCMQFPITAIREMKLLKQMAHQNVVKLHEIVTCCGEWPSYVSFEALTRSRSSSLVLHVTPQMVTTGSHPPSTWCLSSARATSMMF
jgi:serine/threonine protein kinase